MKQYTTPEQTAKLIELGFENPRALVDKYYDYDAEDYAEVKAYSIGELIEMLPTKIEAEVTDEYDSETAYLQIEEGWSIYYFNGWCIVEKCTRATELVDALYYMLIDLLENDLIHLKSNDNTKDN